VLNIVKFQKENVLLVRLSGSIEEGVDFAQLIGPFQQELIISCKEIHRINSAGVKLWITYFQKLATEGKRFRLIECSPAIVEQINLISNFVCGAKIESIYLPFACPSCKSSFITIFNVEELKKTYRNLPEPLCTKCHAKTVFDDLADEYFEFLER
jgi:anti-anti-sigma regulatory factor